MVMARANFRWAQPFPAPQEATSHAPAAFGKPLVQIVSNPASGGHSPRRLKQLRDAYVGNGFDVIFSQSSPVTPFELANGVARVCIAGGDGTVRHVLENHEMRTSDVAVDIYPAGTINLIAREWGVPSDPDGFVEQSTARPARRLFPVGLNDTCFLACASIGPDARAVAGLSVALKRRIGRLAYVVAMMKVLVNWQRPRLELLVDRKPVACEAVFIAKGRFYAGPWSFAPAARLEDADLHIVALRRARRRDFAAFFLAMMAGKVDRLKNVQLAKGREVLIVSDTRQPIQADGDIATHTPARLSVSDHPFVL
jgi:diacylglycerol kinase family enzyme